MENNENKRMYIVIAILASIFVIALLSIIINNIKLNKKLNTIYDSIEGNEYKAVYVMRNNCSYCNLFETSINENEELGYDYIKVDLNDLNENQLSKLAYKLNLGALDKDTYNVLKNYIEELNLNNEEKSVLEYYDLNGEKVDFNLGEVVIKHENFYGYIKNDRIMKLSLYDIDGEVLDNISGNNISIFDDFIIVDNAIYHIDVKKG